MQADVGGIWGVGVGVKMIENGHLRNKTIKKSSYNIKNIRIS
jgi:hypothetical protein